MVKNKDIIQLLLSQKVSPNDLVRYLSLIIKLKQYHSSLFMSKEFHNVLYQADRMLGDIVTILSKTNTLIVKKIKDLISLIEKDSEYQVQLEVAVEGEDFDTAVQYIQETLPESMIIKKDTQDAEISIS